MKNRTKFMPPPTNQIICSKPKEVYHIELTLVPKEFVDDNDKRYYIIAILDHFSKYAEVEIITNKKDKTIFDYIRSKI